MKTLTIDRETNELCTSDCFAVKCPHCGESVCAHDDLVCATLSLGGRKHQLIYHERHIDGDQIDVLKKAGYDVIFENGERMVG